MADFEILFLWFLKPWLPFGAVLLAALAFSMVMSYVWLTRSSGRSGTVSSRVRRRWLPLVALVAPATVALGFSGILFPVAPPETLFLRSRAIGAGTDPVEPGCLKRVSEALRRDTLLDPGCLAAYLQGTDGMALSERSVRAARRLLSSVPRSALLSDDKESKKNFERVLEDATKQALEAEGRSSDDSNLTATVRGRISALVRWWAQAGASRPIDVGPVVDRALQAFDWASFDEKDYSLGTTELIKALQEAVELAISETPPRTLDPGQLPASPNPRRRQVPGVVQEIEAAVVQLAVAQRNVRAAVIEYHPRSEERPEARTWNRLAAKLAEGAGTATGKPVAVALVPGSVRSPGSLLRVVGEPWKTHLNYTDSFKIFAQLRFGDAPSEQWSVSLETETDGSRTPVHFSCGGHPSPDESQPLTDCFPNNWKDLDAGSSAVLNLDVTHNAKIEPTTSLILTITFPRDMGFQPLSVTVADKPESSRITVGIDRHSELFPKLDLTLSCLLESGSRVAYQPSIQWLKSAIGEGGRAPLAKGGEGALIRYDSTNTGIWIYPDGLDWNLVRESIMPRMIVKRAVPFAHLMDEPSEELYGAALFPTAIAAPGMPDGFGARGSIPLRPRRGSPLAPGTDPATNLVLPSTTRILMPEAVPIAFSMIPAHLSTGALATQESSAAPLAWRIDLPDSIDGKQGGRVWYFSVNPEYQGLLLPRNCQPEKEEVLRLLCDGPLDMVQSFEPVYEEKRFFAFWLWILRAARESAIMWKNDAPLLEADPVPPIFVSPAMVSRARIASASGGMLLVGVGLLFHGIFLVWLRLRGDRHIY